MMINVFGWLTTVGAFCGVVAVIRLAIIEYRKYKEVQKWLDDLHDRLNRAKN